MCHTIAVEFETKTENRIIAFSDTRSRVQYKVLNTLSKELSYFQVDGALINDERVEKCDHLLIDCSEENSYFIEIKGSDLIKATQQILSTIAILKPKMAGLKMNARIVLTRVNATDLRDSAFVRFKNIIKDLGGNVKQQSIKLEESLWKKSYHY